MSDKTFASDVTFQLGLATLVVDAVPIKRTGAESATAFKLICPKCATRPQQKYVCPDCDVDYWPNELARAKELEDGTLRPMSPEEIEEIGTSAMDTGVFAVQVCPASELEARTAPSGQAYRLRLAGGKKAKRGQVQAKAYGLFRALASDPDTALYGIARLNGKCSPTPFRVRVWRDQLLIEGLIRPQDLTAPEIVESDIEPAMLDMARQLVQSLSASLEEDSFEDERAKKLSEIVAQAAAPIAVTDAPAPKTDDGPDLMALLAASLSKAA